MSWMTMAAQIENYEIVLDKHELCSFPALTSSTFPDVAALIKCLPVLDVPSLLGCTSRWLRVNTPSSGDGGSMRGRGVNMWLDAGSDRKMHGLTGYLWKEGCTHHTKR